MSPLIYSVTEAAESLGISRAKLYELMNQHEIRPVKIGRRTLIAFAELQRYVATLQGERSTDNAA